MRYIAGYVLYELLFDSYIHSDTDSDTTYLCGAVIKQLNEVVNENVTTAAQQHCNLYTHVNMQICSTAIYTV